MPPVAPAELGRAFPVLASQLDAAGLERLLAALRFEALAAGTTLAAEGAVPAALYLVWSGRFAVSVATPAGPTPVGEVRAGSLVGEVSFLDGGAATATVAAAEPCEVLALERERFEALVREDSPLARAVLRGISDTLAGRIRAVTTRFTELADEQADAGTDRGPASAVPPPRAGLLERVRVLFGIDP